MKLWVFNNCDYPFLACLHSFSGFRVHERSLNSWRELTHRSGLYLHSRHSARHDTGLGLSIAFPDAYPEFLIEKSDNPGSTGLPCSQDDFQIRKFVFFIRIIELRHSPKLGRGHTSPVYSPFIEQLIPFFRIKPACVMEICRACVQNSPEGRPVPFGPSRFCGCPAELIRLCVPPVITVQSVEAVHQ